MSHSEGPGSTSLKLGVGVGVCVGVDGIGVGVRVAVGVGVRVAVGVGVGVAVGIRVAVARRVEVTVGIVDADRVHPNTTDAMAAMMNRADNLITDNLLAEVIGYTMSPPQAAAHTGPNLLCAHNRCTLRY